MLQSLKISDYEMTRQEPAPAPATSYAPVAVTGDGLSVVLIGPDESRRYSVASALTGAPCRVSNQLSSYPHLDQLPRILKQNFDIAILDLDSDPESALELVENLCANSQLTVMVYSMRLDSELMLSCMRAGAREFLTFPITPAAINEAMVRASARRTAVRPGTKENGRLCVFCGAKGGAGVTTMASNFAVSAAKETGEKVLLIDLDLPLGDSALVLGLNAQYSTVDALQNSGRLDSNLLSRLIVQHDSGLHVLAAPGNFVNFDLNQEAVNKLIQVARQEYDTVVIDSGSRFQLKGSAVFGQEAVVYLVSHVGISELRNSNRIISELFPATLPRVEIILNRYSSSALGVDDEHITRALTRPATWRIPEDRATLREMQNTATPLVQGDSGVAKVIKQMARTACGLNSEPEKKKALFGLF
ncbi:AAA family ATPase [Occallatibacter riparius]|uniref:AAA family ATPase n=1 Tax=Occallatibacter riparius TaxID=1002689 RepID=A0A9J7BM63_9BACT|nr:AAA family ATPase [Occallatibacter riparius]UWZ82858.1 AAA family ATPase [Occallatibacter riparius]